MKTKVYGHRGAAGTYPENTMLSFTKAVDMGVDGLEIDVHLTKDKNVVIIHDTTLDRTTSSSGRIKDTKIYELHHIGISQMYKSFESYSNTWDKERIPMLNEFLTLYRNEDIDINIELKTRAENYPGIEEEVYHIVSSLGMTERVVFSSFNLDTVKTIKQLNDDARVAFLSEEVPENPQEFINEYKLEALHLSFQTVMDHKDKFQGLEEYLRVWLINDEESVKKLLDMEVGGIITDYPEMVLKIRSEYYL